MSSKNLDNILNLNKTNIDISDLINTSTWLITDEKVSKKLIKHL